MPAWIEERKAIVKHDMDLDSIVEFKNVREMEIAFMMKLEKGEVDGY